MSKLRLILEDQLSNCISSLEGADKKSDIILMCETHEKNKDVKHHKKKMAFLFSAMRHHALELKKNGYNVEYVKIDSPSNSGSLRGEVLLALKRHSFQQIIVTFPSQHSVLKEIESWKSFFSVLVEIRSDNRFLSTPKMFADWADNKKQIRLEHFYRQMRKKHNILMADNKPIGGKWNYDASNRKTLKDAKNIPKPHEFEPDDISIETIKVVEKQFPDHFGNVEPFYFAVTRCQALEVLKCFIDQRLFYFGDYQDAMLENEPWMYHSHISFYLNCGLLLPLECIRAAEKAYIEGRAPLNSVEGFIRQIIGWREYIRGIYWLKMPKYSEENFLAATRDLPDFYWTSKTKMNCLHQCIKETKTNAYAHHIQRLMILGNFALLAGIDPKQMNEWFWIVYADAYEWVELPNVSGMILFADGGYLASKPYAASGRYINKMSNYCKNCFYKVNKQSGEDACPFNYLYWDFLDRNKKKLQQNHRMGLVYNIYEKMSHEKKNTIQTDSKIFLEDMK